MNFLNILKNCEPNISQITRDSGVSRRAVYNWESALPRRDVFNHLLGMNKYKEALSAIDYNKERLLMPLGRKAYIAPSVVHRLVDGYLVETKD